VSHVYLPHPIDLCGAVVVCVFRRATITLGRA
jgi:hypothetical protein